jgi:hypothetical protein
VACPRTRRRSSDSVATSRSCRSSETVLHGHPITALTTCSSRRMRNTDIRVPTYRNCTESKRHEQENITMTQEHSETKTVAKMNALLSFLNHGSPLCLFSFPILLTNDLLTLSDYTSATRVEVTNGRCELSSRQVLGSPVRHMYMQLGGASSSESTVCPPPGCNLQPR